MKKLAKHLGDPRRTPQSKPIPGREKQMEKGPAGGFVFKAGDWERLDRFLIIGTEGGTYYADEKSLTISNAAVVRRCLAEDATRTLARIAEVSSEAVAPKNDTAILALAVAFCDENARELGDLRRSALRKVCRTGTHLFQFIDAVRGMRGGGRGINGAIRSWFDEQRIGKLGLQMVKYRNREGWTWKDVMRRYRPKPPVLDHIEESPDLVGRVHLYKWAAGKEAAMQWLPPVVRAYIDAQNITKDRLPEFIREHRLPREAIPQEHAHDKAVLDALFDEMPMMATVRNLSRLEMAGVLTDRLPDLLERLSNEEAIERSRIHPVALMMAAHFYEVGRGRERGSKTMTWTPNPTVVDALDDAFQLALKTAEPTGKKILVAIDSSGSMHGTTSSAGIPLFKIAAAMALTYVRTDGASVIAFDAEPSALGSYGRRSPWKDRRGVYPLALSQRMRVTDAMRAISELGMGGGTDCSLPFKYALENDLDVDAFVCFTDNESWAGYGQHAAQAFREYQQKKNPKAKCVWAAMTAGKSSLGLPEDASCLGITGFDSSAPKLVGEFVSGMF